MLNIGNRDDGMTIQITHLPACAVFLLDIPVCDLTFLLQSVLQSVVKALFDIESDFVKVNIHMGSSCLPKSGTFLSFERISLFLVILEPLCLYSFQFIDC